MKKTHVIKSYEKVMDKVTRDKGTKRKKDNTFVDLSVKI